LDREKWQALEFEQLRGELNNRVDFLHKSINLAIIFWLIFLIMSFFFMAIGMPKNIFYTFLLLIPVVMDLLGFNYQSNQNSLESIPRYFQYHLKPILDEKHGDGMLAWEKFFADEKFPFRFESVTKVFPFVLPSIIPFYFLFAKVPLENYQAAILAIDLILLVLMLSIFRYKLRRVK
jgi:uncharacterized membrane protein